MSEFTIRRRFPNYCTGFEETEHQINNRQDLESIDWVKHAFENKQTYCLAISVDDGSYRREGEKLIHTLMIVTNYDEEFGGCKGWWAIGYIIGDNVDELDLPEWETLTGNHKDGCPQKKWQHDKCECGFKG